MQNEETGLFAELQEKNISDVDLTGSELTIKTQITGKSTDSVGTLHLIYQICWYFECLV